jgi:serine/threonine protein kinase
MDETTGKPKDDLLGKVLGQYEILEEAGRGGMATVYRARQLSINRIVAVKVLPRNLLHDPGFFERFEREVDLIAHLEHPHILPIYDYGKAEEVPFIAMRYLAGGSLAQWIRRGPIKVDALDRPLTQVAQALDYAHNQGIIHRDIKPGNIMLDEANNAYLSDFGIARVLGSNLTGSAIIGTPAYMSPEQANGMPLDARSDIYALGIVLFELITGREPFQAETPMALLLKHITEPVPSVRSFRPDVPAGVEDVINRSTAKDPNNRYSSAGDMARDFNEALRGSRTFPPAAPARTAVEDSPTIIPDAGAGRPPTNYPTPYPPTPYPPTPYPAQQPPTGMPPGTSPTGVPITYTMPAQPRSNLPVILSAVALIAVVALAAVLVLPRLTAPSGPPPVTNIPSTLPPPTPFSGARSVDQTAFSMMIPASWKVVNDTSGQTERVRNIWEAPDKSGFISVVNMGDALGTEAFNSAVKGYARRWYDDAVNKGSLKLIDEAVAPDGTERYSYRATAGDYPPGQLDVFFLDRKPKLVVVELFSADSTGNNLVPIFQQVLDSLRMKEGA